MIKEQSFGVIPLTNERGQWEVFLIQHKGSRYWGFPKGHGEPGETPEESARRELKEETNLDIIQLLRNEPLIEQYIFSKERRRVSKTVSYFVARVGGKVQLQQEEISNGKWVPLSDAHNQVTHKEGKNILIEVEKILQ